MPSPQTGKQAPATPKQSNPVSSLHPESQPSPGVRLLSSHISVPSSIPFPHF